MPNFYKICRRLIITPMDRKKTKTTLTPGFYVSPGFYMAFWKNAVLKQFQTKTILEHQKFKPYREVWVGAIVAASRKLATGADHFVGLPATEPPDFVIARLIEEPFKGIMSTRMERYHFEVTRCDFDAGETIIGQITKKNKPAWSSMGLVVYLLGNVGIVDFEQIYQELQGMEIVLESIVLVGTAYATPSGILMPQSYTVTQVFPSRGQNVSAINDPKAFFRHPEVFRPDGRATGVGWNDLGSFELMPPEVKNSSTVRE